MKNGDEGENLALQFADKYWYLTKKSLAGGAFYFGEGKWRCYILLLFFLSISSTPFYHHLAPPPPPLTNEGARTIMINVFNLDLLQLNVFIQGIYKLRILCIIFVWLYIIKDKYFLFRGVYYCSNVNIKLFIRELFLYYRARIFERVLPQIFMSVNIGNTDFFFYLTRSLYLDWTQRFSSLHAVIEFWFLTTVDVYTNRN